MLEVGSCWVCLCSCRKLLWTSDTHTHTHTLELSTAQQEQEAEEEEEDVNRTEYIWDVVNVSHIMLHLHKMMLRETFGTSTAAGAKPKQNHWENGRVWKETEIQRVTEKEVK